jgi:uncharacterized protein YeaO (DUF488 family)
MLTRYKILYMQKIPADAPEAAPGAKRIDTRKHTRNCLRPTKEMVERYQKDPESYPWNEFESDYLKLLRERFEEDRSPFDEIAELARHQDVFLGCSCPTKNNPDVYQCHTVLALRFIKASYPDLTVVFPAQR